MELTINVDETTRNGSLLFKAARTNDTRAMKKLLESTDVDPFIRGNLEETILHTALLNGNKDVMEVIVEMVPSLINEPMTSEMYKGETPLHIAILKQDISMVHYLLQHGADPIHARANGSCFVPGQYGQCYYGEYVLSFAACLGNEEIVTLLLKHGAPLQAQDSLGNTVLHVLVLQADKELACFMYDIVTSLVTNKQKHKVQSIENSNGYTPLQLAAAEGDTQMFNYLVQKQKRTYWTMGTISYCVYDLTHIDTWGDHKSVLDIITSSKKMQVRKLVDIRPVKELLHHKWKTFGLKYFMLWMISYIAYTSIFTAVCLYRPLKRMPDNQTDNFTVMIQKTLAESYQTKGDYIRLSGELFTILGAVVILASEVPYLARIGPRNFFGNASIGGPFPLLMVAFSFSIFIAVVFRILGMEEESIPLSVALIIGWCNTIYFARGFRMLGQFSIMIQKIIFGDLLQWCCLLFIAIIAFSSALYILFQTLNLKNYPYFRDFQMTLYTAVELMMGLIDFPIPYNNVTPSFIYIVYVLYMIFAYLLMLNLLIAMMDDTYWRVAQEREELWKVQIAATILLLEKRIPKFLRHRSGVPGITLGFNDDDKWYFGVQEIIPEEKGKIQAGGIHMVKSVGWEVIRSNLSKIANMKEYSESTPF
ncbi:transient receptor potential cation channel subfamily V member 6-like [Polypterus senegalus]